MSARRQVQKVLQHPPRVPRVEVGGAQRAAVVDAGRQALFHVRGDALGVARPALQHIPAGQTYTTTYKAATYGRARTYKWGRTPGPRAHTGSWPSPCRCRVPATRASSPSRGPPCLPQKLHCPRARAPGRQTYKTTYKAALYDDV